MKQEEFITQNSRVSEYSRLQDREKKLTYERDLIGMGILNINTAYQKQISFTNERKLEEKIIEAICNVYNKEIDTIVKSMTEI